MPRLLKRNYISKILNSVHFAWFIHVYKNKIKNQGITHINESYLSKSFLVFVPNISLHFNPINSQSLKETSYSIWSKASCQINFLTHKLKLELIHLKTRLLCICQSKLNYHYCYQFYKQYNKSGLRVIIQ